VDIVKEWDCYDACADSDHEYLDLKKIAAEALKPFEEGR